MSSLTTTTPFRFDKFQLFVFILAELALFAISIYFESPLFIIAGLFALAFFLWSFYSVEKTFYILLFYIGIFPSYASYLRYPYLGIWAFLEVIALLLLVLFFYDFSSTIMQRKKVFFQRMTIMDKLVSLFLVWAIVSALWGLVNAGDFKYIYQEVYFFSLYLAYFIVRRNFDSFERLNRLWFLFVILSVIVSFEYIYIAYRETGLGTGILIKRVSTQQPHLSQLAFPYLIGFLLFKSENVKKKWVIAAMIPNFMMIFFSQQRGLWVGILFSTLLIWGLSFIRAGATFKNFIKFIFFLLLGVAAIVGIGLLIDTFFLGSTILTMFERLSTLLELAKDASFLIRFREITNALEQWKHYPLIGTGFGATINPILLEHFSINLVDNSYVVFLWKSGLIGLIIYLFMMLLFFIRGLYVFKNTTQIAVQRLVASLLAGFAGLFVVALTNSCLAYYRYNIIWATTFATIELLYLREKKLH
jgi:hypothetical protein